MSLLLLPSGDLRKENGTKVCVKRIKRFSLLILISHLLNFSDLVLEVLKDMPAWPGRHLLEGGENRKYFGLKTVMRGVVEFECRNQREYDIWTQGVSRLLSIAAEKRNRIRASEFP